MKPIKNEGTNMKMSETPIDSEPKLLIPHNISYHVSFLMKIILVKI